MFRFEFFKKDIGITSKHGHNETCVCVCWRESFWFLSLTYIITSYEQWGKYFLKWTYEPSSILIKRYTKLYKVRPFIFCILLQPFVSVNEGHPFKNRMEKISYSSLFSMCLSEDSKHSQWWPTTMMCIEEFHNHLLWMGKRHFFFILQICNDNIHIETYVLKQAITKYQG